MRLSTIVIRIALIAWIAVWILFLVRPYVVKGQGREYATLMRLPLDGKHAAVVGAELYDFIGWCNAAIAPASSYALEGVIKDSLDYRRVAYYLYPRCMRTDPDFICVFHAPVAVRAGYHLYQQRDGTDYILAKDGVQ